MDKNTSILEGRVVFELYSGSFVSPYDQPSWADLNKKTKGKWNALARNVSLLAHAEEELRQGAEKIVRAKVISESYGKSNTEFSEALGAQMNKIYESLKKPEIEK